MAAGMCMQKFFSDKLSMIGKSLVGFILLMTSACAVDRVSSIEKPLLPTKNEVIKYIAEHWDEWSPRFARFALRHGEKADLLNVDQVSCDYLYFTPECSVNVTAQFQNGSHATVSMAAQFERENNGKIKEVIALYHQRQR